MIMNGISHSNNSIFLIQQKSLKVYLIRKLIQFIKSVILINTYRMIKIVTY